MADSRQAKKLIAQRDYIQEAYEKAYKTALVYQEALADIFFDRCVNPKLTAQLALWPDGDPDWEIASGPTELRQDAIESRRVSEGEHTSSELSP